MLTGILLYPDSRKKKIYFEYSYYIKQKLCDAVITFSSFSIFVIAFNTNLFMQPAYGIMPVREYGYTGILSHDDSGKITNRQKRLTQKLVKQFKHFSAPSKKHKKKACCFGIRNGSGYFIDSFFRYCSSCALLFTGLQRKRSGGPLSFGFWGKWYYYGFNNVDKVN